MVREDNRCDLRTFELMKEIVRNHEADFIASCSGIHLLRPLKYIAANTTPVIANKKPKPGVDGVGVGVGVGVTETVGDAVGVGVGVGDAVDVGTVVTDGVAVGVGLKGVTSTSTSDVGTGVGEDGS